MFKVFLTSFFILCTFLIGCKREKIERSVTDTTKYTEDPLLLEIQKKITKTDEEFLDLIQSQTLRYFWEGADEKTGMALERNNATVVTTGGTGFGIMAIIVGVERGWIERDTAVFHILKIAHFLKNAERFHGAWSHWIKRNDGQVQAFSQKDDGGDLVETAFLVQGLLTAKEYFNDTSSIEEDSLTKMIDTLWREVEWDWYTKQGQEKVLYWHWSKNYGWEMNHKIQGWNEALIVYVLAASSPTHPITKQVYDEGWAKNGAIKNGKEFYSIIQPLGWNKGGPLFFSHYSFLGLDPRKLSDQYANYWEQNVAHTKINRAYCIDNPKQYPYYSDTCWGLTASDEKEGYLAHEPNNDNGTITPTAALSSMPYTPQESLKVAKFIYSYLYKEMWGSYGFKDAFDLKNKWFANSYLAIDQGPIVVMIENYRSQKIWNTFMKNIDIQTGLTKLEFNY